jgi:hypothetical protein
MENEKRRKLLKPSSTQVHYSRGPAILLFAPLFHPSSTRLRETIAQLPSSTQLRQIIVQLPSSTQLRQTIVQLPSSTWLRQTSPDDCVVEVLPFFYLHPSSTQFH